MRCPYCTRAAILTTGASVYPHRPELAAKRFYACFRCKAWVGCHPGTITPLGRIANAELRAAKSAAHLAFDLLWRSGQMKRYQAYAWLADRLGIAREQAHIGMFDISLCQRAIDACACRVEVRK